MASYKSCAAEAGRALTSHAYKSYKSCAAEAGSSLPENTDSQTSLCAWKAIQCTKRSVRGDEYNKIGCMHQQSLPQRHALPTASSRGCCSSVAVTQQSYNSDRGTAAAPSALQGILRMFYMLQTVLDSSIDKRDAKPYCDSHLSYDYAYDALIQKQYNMLSCCTVCVPLRTATPARDYSKIRTSRSDSTTPTKCADKACT